MRTRLRQVALVAEDLAAAETAIETELGLSLCYRDPGVATFGLANALFPVGDKLLEVVSPVADGTTAERLLTKRGGDGGYMVLFQVDDVAEMRRRFAETGVRIVWDAAYDGIIDVHVHPRDVGGAIVAVEQTEDWASWPIAGPVWREHVRTDVVIDLAAVEIHADDPDAMASRWAQVFGGELDGRSLHFEEGTIRFAFAGPRGEGVAGIDMVGASGSDREVDVCGTTVRITGAPR